MDEVAKFEKDSEADWRITETVRKEQSRLRSFIRWSVPDRADAEDILQDVFYELVEAYRLMKPIEQAGAWLFRVARNKIIDLSRKKKPEPLRERQTPGEDGEPFTLDQLLPSPDEGPEAAYARTILLEELDGALNELPDEQREIFLAHEIEGRTFKELARESGLSINTLLSRKRYAVLHLRRRLRGIYNELIER